MVHAGDIAEMQGFITEYFGPYPLFIAVRFNDWERCLLRRSRTQACRFRAASINMRAASRLPRRAMSRGRRKRAPLLPRSGTRCPRAVYGYSAGADVLGVALAVLDGRIATAKGDRKAAIGHFEAAVAIQDKLAYNEPADWYYPVRETLGAALLMDGEPRSGGGVPRRL